MSDPRTAVKSRIRSLGPVKLRTMGRNLRRNSTRCGNKKANKQGGGHAEGKINQRRG
jgi:hypothetical protein